MKICKTYSAEEFANKVDEKVANIRAFRLFAREFGLLQNNEPLTEDFIPAWQIAQKLHYEDGVKWENAMKHALKEVFNFGSEANTGPTTSNIEEKIDEILYYLKKIATSLEK